VNAVRIENQMLHERKYTDVMEAVPFDVKTATGQIPVQKL
jgi:hypothetical protein